MQSLSGNQRPDLQTSLMNMSLVSRLPREIHLCISLEILFQCPTPAKVGTATNPHVSRSFDRVQNPLRLPHKRTLQRPKMVRAYMFASTCASRHKSFFLHISTSKRALQLMCFAHFDLDMCFASQRLALSQQLDVQKCSNII